MTQVPRVDKKHFFLCFTLIYVFLFQLLLTDMYKNMEYRSIDWQP